MNSAEGFALQCYSYHKELGCLCGKAGTSHLCDGSAHSSGCVVNGYGCLLSYYYLHHVLFNSVLLYVCMYVSCILP